MAAVDGSKTQLWINGNKMAAKTQDGSESRNKHKEDTNI